MPAGRGSLRTVKSPETRVESQADGFANRKQGLASRQAKTASDWVARLVHKLCHSAVRGPEQPSARERQPMRPVFVWLATLVSGLLTVFPANGGEDKAERACKPGSVVDDHFSRAAVACRLEQPTRRLGTDRTGPWRGKPRSIFCLVLLPVGFTKPDRSPGPLVRSYRTVSPLPRPPCGGRSAVCFLWHCPGPCGRWALPTTVSCEARTFLSEILRFRSGRPARSALAL